MRCQIFARAGDHIIVATGNNSQGQKRVQAGECAEVADDAQLTPATAPAHRRGAA
jgi:hypothetical protein